MTKARDLANIISGGSSYANGTYASSVTHTTGSGTAAGGPGINGIDNGGGE